MSRVNYLDSSKHAILGTQQFRPREFATQIALNMDNAWGVLRCIIDTCMKLPDGKYLILKDPLKVSNCRQNSVNFIFLEYVLTRLIIQTRVFYLRNRKHVRCFCRVIETRVKVWENEQCLSPQSSETKPTTKLVLVSREPLLYLEFNKPNKQNVYDIILYEKFNFSQSQNNCRHTD